MATLIKSNGTGGGDWDQTTSWDGGVVPTESTHVEIVAGDVIVLVADTTIINIVVDVGGDLDFAGFALMTSPFYSYMICDFDELVTRCDIRQLNDLTIDNPSDNINYLDKNQIYEPVLATMENTGSQEIYNYLREAYEGDLPAINQTPEIKHMCAKLCMYYLRDRRGTLTRNLIDERQTIIDRLIDMRSKYHNETK